MKFFKDIIIFIRFTVSILELFDVGSSTECFLYFAEQDYNFDFMIGFKPSNLF